MAQERFTGVVQYFNKSKGFGFIKPDDGGDDLFIHHSSIKSDGFPTLLQGDRVEFAIAAVDVTGPNGAPLRSNQDTHSGGRAPDIYRGSNAGNAARACFNCGGFGHVARDCLRGSNRGGGDGYCYRCDEFGHTARDCTKGKEGGSYDGKRPCFNCGKPGHFARECLEASGRGSPASFNISTNPKDLASSSPTTAETTSSFTTLPSNPTVFVPFYKAIALSSPSPPSMSPAPTAPLSAPIKTLTPTMGLVTGAVSLGTLRGTAKDFALIVGSLGILL